MYEFFQFNLILFFIQGKEHEFDKFVTAVDEEDETKIYNNIRKCNIKEIQIRRYKKQKKKKQNHNDDDKNEFI